MKTKLLSVSALVLFGSVNAHAVHFEPAACPSVSAIKNIGIQTIGMEGGKWVGIIANNSFDTPDDWIFMVATSGNTPEERLKNANQALDNLINTDGPYAHSTYPAWICKYQSAVDQSIKAMALSMYQ